MAAGCGIIYTDNIAELHVFAHAYYRIIINFHKSLVGLKLQCTHSRMINSNKFVSELHSISANREHRIMCCCWLPSGQISAKSATNVYKWSKLRSNNIFHSMSTVCGKFPNSIFWRLFEGAARGYLRTIQCLVCI